MRIGGEVRQPAPAVVSSSPRAHEPWHFHHLPADAPIQTAALRLFATETSVVHLDMDYIHLPTRNHIRGGAEVPFQRSSSSPISDEHFRRRALQDTNLTSWIAHAPPTSPCQPAGGSHSRCSSDCHGSTCQSWRSGGLITCSLLFQLGCDCTGCCAETPPSPPVPRAPPQPPPPPQVPRPPQASVPVCSVTGQVELDASNYISTSASQAFGGPAGLTLYARVWRSSSLQGEDILIDFADMPLSNAILIAFENDMKYTTRDALGQVSHLSVREVSRGSSEFPSSAWTDVAIVHSPDGHASIYWEGVLKASGPVTLPARVPRSPLLIGRSQSQSRYAHFEGN
eukprot:7168404-Prymnesium_polylepis.1